MGLSLGGSRVIWTASEWPTADTVLPHERVGRGSVKETPDDPLHNTVYEMPIERSNVTRPHTHLAPGALEHWRTPAPCPNLPLPLSPLPASLPPSHEPRPPTWLRAHSLTDTMRSWLGCSTCPTLPMGLGSVVAVGKWPSGSSLGVEGCEEGGERHGRGHVKTQSVGMVQAANVGVQPEGKE